MFGAVKKNLKTCALRPRTKHLLWAVGFKITVELVTNKSKFRVSMIEMI